MEENDSEIQIMRLFKNLESKDQIHLVDMMYNTGSNFVKERFHAKGGRRPRKNFSDLLPDSKTKRIHLVISLLKKMLMDKSSPHTSSDTVKVHHTFNWIC